MPTGSASYDTPAFFTGPGGRDVGGGVEREGAQGDRASVDVWVDLKPLRGYERTQARRTEASVTHRGRVQAPVETPQGEALRLTPQHRLVLVGKDRTLEIVSVYDVGEDDFVYEMELVEDVG